MGCLEIRVSTFIHERATLQQIYINNREIYVGRLFNQFPFIFLGYLYNHMVLLGWFQLLRPNYLLRSRPHLIYITLLIHLHLHILVIMLMNYYSVWRHLQHCKSLPKISHNVKVLICPKSTMKQHLRSLLLLRILTMHQPYTLVYIGTRKNTRCI